MEQLTVAPGLFRRSHGGWPPAIGGALNEQSEGEWRLYRIAPVNTGFNLVLHGQMDKGIGLIEKGIAKGGSSIRKTPS